MFDVVVVGAGFAGAVFARELAAADRRVLLVEKRTHVAGNCYDCFDDHGILIHKYGPHLLHTSSRKVFEYLGRFTDWTEYQHRVLAYVDGCTVPLPFNMNSLRRLFPAGLADVMEERLVAEFGLGKKVPVLQLQQTDDPHLKFLADFIYEKIFVNYTAKQWGCSPREIDSGVMARVPVLISRDDRYFHDRYQAVPKTGYTRLFENMLNHPNIHLMLNTDYHDVLQVDPGAGKITLFGHDFPGELVFTGMIDDLFDFRFGELPYRALSFSFEHLDQEFFQSAAVVNYPDNFDFTRITEFKRISGQRAGTTTILREYPHGYDRDDPEKNIPCYPVVNGDSVQLYERYKEIAAGFDRLTMVGRLAEYTYYDMDDIVERSLQVSREKFGCATV